jgi:hypothetical protein
LWIVLYSWAKGEVPFAFKVIISIGFVGSLIARGIARRERVKQRKRVERKRQEEEETQMMFDQE